MSKDKLIPELRFPEFVNEGEWKKKSLIETANKKVKWSFTGGPFGSNLQASDYTSEGIRIIQLQNIADGEFNDTYKIYTSKKKADELLSCNIYSGEIIISKMGDPVGRACIIPDFLKRCVMASDGIRLVIDEEKYSKYFIYSLINSKPVREGIEKKATGSTRKRIGLDDLREIELIVPKLLPEQQKIASCLSYLDDVIEAQTEKIEQLRLHKKGLMQNLFPQEGETVPKHRFPEFENDGEWVENTLEDLTTINQGLQIPISERFTEKVENSFFYITNEFLKSNSERRYYIKNPSESVRCIEEDVLMTRTGNTGQVVTGVSGAFHNNFFKIQFDRKILNKDFFVYFLRLAETQRIIISYAGASTIPDLNHSDFYRILIKIPSTKEQQKIASCLSSLDELITAQVERIEQLKQHKKGLMQGLFPIIND